MSAAVPLKDYFGAELAQLLSDLIRLHDPGFPDERFVSAGMKGRWS
jgi:hypothetical protein